MLPENIVIELCGGHLDGYHKVLRYVPLEARLQLRAPAGAATAQSTVPRVAVYERRPPRLVIVDAQPWLIYRYEFVGITDGPPIPVSSSLWNHVRQLWKRLFRQPHREVTVSMTETFTGAWQLPAPRSPDLGDRPPRPARLQKTR